MPLHSPLFAKNLSTRQGCTSGTGLTHTQTHGGGEWGMGAATETTAAAAVTTNVLSLSLREFPIGNNRRKGRVCYY